MKRQYDITDSEWIILRVLLNESPLGSKKIVESVNVQNNWSVATVKTFLNRLVSKGVIAYRKNKNSFEYFPVVTEMEYVRNEMKSFYSKIYGETIHYETRNFQFAGHHDLEYVKYLGAKLEDYYEIVSNDLDVKIFTKQLIYIYPTLKGLHSALGYENGPQWLQAGWFWEIVHLAPKECNSRLKPEALAFHVFTQLLIHYINPRTPFWLLQGVSAYKSNWLTQSDIKTAITTLKDQLHVNSIFRISSDDEGFKAEYGYELTYTVIEYILSKYDNEKLALFIKNPGLLFSIFECSENQFWNSWLIFIKEKYLYEN